MPEAIKKRRQQTGEDFLTAKAWVDTNITVKRVLRKSLTAFWDGQGNLEIIAWVSKGNDAPHIITNSDAGAAFAPYRLWTQRGARYRPKSFLTQRRFRRDGPHDG